MFQCKKGLHWELLYVDELVLMAVSEKNVMKKEEGQFTIFGLTSVYFTTRPPALTYHFSCHLEIS